MKIMEVTFAKEYSAILKDLLHYLGLMIPFLSSLNRKSVVSGLVHLSPSYSKNHFYQLRSINS